MPYTKLSVPSDSGVSSFSCFIDGNSFFLRPSISGLRKVWASELVDLLERMWAHEHQERPTMSEVVQELEQLVHAHSHKK